MLLVDAKLWWSDGPGSIADAGDIVPLRGLRSLVLFGHPSPSCKRRLPLLSRTFPRRLLALGELSCFARRYWKFTSLPRALGVLESELTRMGWEEAHKSLVPFSSEWDGGHQETRAPWDKSEIRFHPKPHLCWLLPLLFPASLLSLCRDFFINCCAFPP